MRLIEDVSECASTAIVGLAKNAGKTECLNFLLRGLHRTGHPTAVSSIGLDGETTDAVTRTPKPEITIYPGMLFATSETHYRQRRLTSEILGVGRRRTALGRVVVARAVTAGRTIVSGPADTVTMGRLIEGLHAHGARTVLVDGALSRLSPASPAVASSLVLATGAAVASTVSEICTRTRFVCSLMELPAVSRELARGLAALPAGVYAVTDEDEPVSLGIASALAMPGQRDRLFAYGTRLYVSGAVGDRMLEFLASQPEVARMELIVRDFTRIFATPRTVGLYRHKGGGMSVLDRARLLAVTVNPRSPQGFDMDSCRLCGALSEQLTVPVYDIRNNLN